MLKARLAAHEPLLGTVLKTPHPHVVEVLATSGLDCNSSFPGQNRIDNLLRAHS